MYLIISYKEDTVNPVYQINRNSAIYLLHVILKSLHVVKTIKFLSHKKYQRMSELLCKIAEVSVSRL